MICFYSGLLSRKQFIMLAVFSIPDNNKNLRSHLLQVLTWHSREASELIMFDHILTFRPPSKVIHLAK